MGLNVAGSIVFDDWLQQKRAVARGGQPGYPDLRTSELSWTRNLCRTGCGWRNHRMFRVCHFFEQRWQPPCRTGAGAALQVSRIEMQHAVCPIDAELAAGGWAPLIDAATHLLADLPLQRCAARRLLVGSLHASPEVVQVFRQVDRDRTCRGIIRLGPVKRHTKIGAARATSETRVFLRHCRSRC